MPNNAELQQEVETALKEDQENFLFETPLGEEASPLNQPVKEKDIAHIETEVEEQPEENELEPSSEQDFSPPNAEEHDDAPEQIINENFDPLLPPQESDEPIEIPTEHANTMANSILGMTNNFFALGMGFFVKIKKEKDFYEFDEVIQVIDEFNEKNVKKVILDKEDQALIKPLLIQILKKKSKLLSPEQQLAGVVVSILLKKIQMMAEIRKGNEALLDQISEMIRSSKEEETEYKEEAEQEFSTEELQELKRLSEEQEETQPESQPKA